MEHEKVQATPKAKPISEMTDQERRQLYAKRRRERAGKSKLDVKGKPGVHYFWAAKDDDAEMIRLKGDEYSIVKEKDPQKPEITAAGLREDGTYQIGDVILMQCPEEKYQEHLLDVEMRAEELISGAIEDFRSEQEQRGVPVFETSGRGR